MPPLTAKPYLRSVQVDPQADIDVDRYPFTIPAVRDLGVLEPHPDVTFFVGENGATHSPILLAYPRAKILSFDSTGIAEIGYEDTEHYAITRDFLNHYPRRLQQLLDN